MADSVEFKKADQIIENPLPVFWFEALAGNLSREIFQLGLNFQAAVHNNNGLQAMEIHREIQKMVREYHESN